MKDTKTKNEVKTTLKELAKIQKKIFSLANKIEKKADLSGNKEQWIEQENYTRIYESLFSAQSVIAEEIQEIQDALYRAI